MPTFPSAHEGKQVRAARRPSLDEDQIAERQKQLEENEALRYQGARDHDYFQAFHM
jgi:hypothetical protein